MNEEYYISNNGLRIGYLKAYLSININMFRISKRMHRISDKYMIINWENQA